MKPLAALRFIIVCLEEALLLSYIYLKGAGDKFRPLIEQAFISASRTTKPTHCQHGKDSENNIF
jgi:hypothetical protein